MGHICRKALFVCVTSLLFVAQAQPKVDMGEFSATITRTVAGETTTGKTFISKNKMRDENMSGGKAGMAGSAGISIIRMDKGITWILMENKQYMEMETMDNQDLALMEKDSEKKFEIKSLGREKVNGYDCEVKQYIDKERKMGVTTMWYSPKLKYMVKNEHTGKEGKVDFKQEMTAIKEGKQPTSLFEVPPGYVKFDPYSQLPAGMRGMMKGMMKGGAGMPKNMGSEEDGE